MIGSLVRTYVLIDAVLLVLFFFVGSYTWVINLQVSFISALILSFATYFSYKKMVTRDSQGLIDSGADVMAEADPLSQFDDKHELFDDEEYEKIERPGFKGSVKNLKVSLFSALSFYRIIGYGILIYGFFFLTNNTFFSIVPYITGFLIIPLANLVMYKKVSVG